MTAPEWFPEVRGCTHPFEKRVALKGPCEAEEGPVVACGGCGTYVMCVDATWVRRNEDKGAPHPTVDLVCFCDPGHDLLQDCPAPTPRPNEDAAADPCPHCPHDMDMHDPMSCEGDQGACPCTHWPPLEELDRGEA